MRGRMTMCALAAAALAIAGCGGSDDGDDADGSDRHVGLHAYHYPAGVSRCSATAVPAHNLRRLLREDPMYNGLSPLLPRPAERDDPDGLGWIVQPF